MHLKLLSAIVSAFLLCTTKAFVKIDVSKLTSTSTIVPSPTTTPTPTTVTQQQNVTSTITTTLTTTTTPTPTTVSSVPTMNTNTTTVNSTSSTEQNQTAINVTRPSLDDHVPRTSRVKISPDHYYCTCDLMVNFCDINCCCDNDCTEVMLSVFVCDEKQWSIYDFEYDAGLASCEIRNDLFCVVGKEAVSKVATFDATLFGERSRYKWPVMFASYASDDDESRENYKSGDAVLAFDEKTEEIRAFVFPYSLTGDYCHTNVPIKYLNNFESKCLRSYEQILAFLNDFQLKLKSTKVLKMRRVNHAMMLEHCTDVNDHCLEIQMVDCFGPVSRENCVQFNSTDIDDTKWLNREILIQFRHNFTNILNCTVFLIYSNEMPVSSLMHSVKIQFLQANESMANIHRISGNIGYMQGKPIITATMVPFNASIIGDENSPKILDYFHPNKTFSNDEHFMKVPAIRKNDCVLTNLTYDVIRFGENLFLTCDVVLDEKNVTMESNFTQICSTLQRKIFTFMLNEYRESNATNDIYLAAKISEYGNPKNDSNYWTSANLKHGIVDAVQSKYEPDDNNGNEFICQNMILSTSFEFMYASLRVGSFEHQNLIKTVDVVFGTRVDLKFNLNETIKVPIFVDVMFIDLTSTASFLRCDLMLWMGVLISLVIVSTCSNILIK